MTMLIATQMNSQPGTADEHRVAEHIIVRSVYKAIIIAFVFLN